MSESAVCVFNTKESKSLAEEQAAVHKENVTP